MISLSYSRISLADIAQKLQLDSPEDAEFIVAKVKSRPPGSCAVLSHVSRHCPVPTVLQSLIFRLRLLLGLLRMLRAPSPLSVLCPEPPAPVTAATFTPNRCLGPWGQWGP